MSKRYDDPIEFGENAEPGDEVKIRYVAESGSRRDAVGRVIKVTPEWATIRVRQGTAEYNLCIADLVYRSPGELILNDTSKWRRVGQYDSGVIVDGHDAGREQ